MPVIFLLSAIVSGMALLIVMYIVISKATGQAVDHDCVRLYQVAAGLPGHRPGD
jgi:formate-dependent nitrite reductase membrane component NrfD